MTDTTESDIRTITLRFAAHAEHLVLARLVLTGIAVAEGLASSVVSDLKLAVTEACTNAIEHAYAGDGEAPRDVHVTYRVAAGEIQIEVTDTGSGFDPASVRSALDAPPALQRDGGMGLSIIESLVDELVIDADGEGSRLTMRKRFEAQVTA